MKAVVVEVKNSISSVLRTDGVFENLNAKLTVGETIDTDDYKKKAVVKFKPLYRGIAAAAAVLLVVGGTYSQTAYASSYVTVDGDSSVELAINNLGRVISVTAVDEDSQEAVAELYERNIRFDTVEEAIEKTREVLIGDAAADSDETLIIDIASDNEKRRENISQRVMETCESFNGTKNVEMSKSSFEDRRAAKENNMSTGKYKYYKEHGNEDSYKEPEDGLNEGTELKPEEGTKPANEGDGVKPANEGDEAKPEGEGGEVKPENEGEGEKPGGEAVNNSGDSPVPVEGEKPQDDNQEITTKPEGEGNIKPGDDVKPEGEGNGPISGSEGEKPDGNAPAGENAPNGNTGNMDGGNPAGEKPADAP
ncbi:MAG: hypothetical protein K5669_05245 [Lachnospiraceae bacterium]|nr:hypothetical protein [Lachnospiraceae bacterium]